jgi:hypothetical protein
VAVWPLTAAPPLDLKGQFKFEFNKLFAVGPNLEKGELEHACVGTPLVTASSHCDMIRSYRANRPADHQRAQIKISATRLTARPN